MNTDNIIYSLPLKGIVRSHVELKSLEQQIYDRLIHIPQIDSLKSSIQLVELVCMCVENSVAKNNSKKGKDAIDKKALVIAILDKLFTLTSLEKEIISRHIEYLCDSRVIKRIGRLSRIWYAVSRFFCPAHQTSLQTTSQLPSSA
jgi:hypothetical protein